MLQTKVQDKKPYRNGDKQFIQQRFQGNDHKNVQRTLEKTRWTQWEVRLFLTELENIK